MIVIDGSFGEGGGQIVRTAVGLAAVLRKPVKIVNIRAKRKNPGLQHQHLTAIKAVGTLSKAIVEGAYVGSTAIYFEPKELVGGRFSFDVGTAGSVTLVLQALMPLLPYLPSRTVIELRGGTDVPWSPPVDYVRYVLEPMVRKLNMNIEVELIKRGHYPKGGGVVRIQIEPTNELRGVELTDRGALLSVGGVSHCVKLPSHVAERQARAAREALVSKGLRVPVSISIDVDSANREDWRSPGSGIVLYAVFERSVIGADALGEKGKPAELVGKEAAEKLFVELSSGASVDVHMADMLVPLAGLAKGLTRYTASKVTLHTETVLKIVEIMCGCDAKISRAGELSLIEIKGVGLRL